ncbi:hypothetical protein [Flavobacterium poyangense]|uniref:hypothetical protein n=1 Tax=Flavobacterium poyangense TaxID=2204302 RepID=UPI001420A8DE|nr:hypothetical protein [Flavobacterium sp. JXAS1]
MKQNFMLFLVLMTLLISCKDSLKQKVKSENPNIAKQEVKILKSDTTTSSDKFPGIFSVKAKKGAVTTELSKCIGKKIENVELVDFTGDQITDFICRTLTDTEGIEDEYWVSSEYKILKKTKYYPDNFYYRWFLNLDSDPEPEMFQALGAEDGADYTILDQNLLTGKDSTLLYVNPIIIENHKRYWGYPWDIDNIKVRKNGSVIELFCSLNHQITRDGNEETDPELQKQIPVLFFTGKHTQESPILIIKEERWLSLQEIIRQTKK